MSHCQRLTNAAVLALADGCGGTLKGINLRGTRVTDDAVEALALRCSLLKTMDLEGCLLLTDAGLLALGRGTGLSYAAPTDGGGSGGGGGGGDSTNALSSSSLLPIDGGGGGDEAEEGAPQTLQSLSVSGCVRLTDASIVSVASSCRKLSHVDLTQVYDLTDASVVALAESSGQHLASVKLSRCGRITDEAIASLAAHCPLLRAIAVDDCYSLTDTSIMVLAKSCPLLKTADLSHCPYLTDESVSHPR